MSESLNGNKLKGERGNGGDTVSLQRIRLNSNRVLDRKKKKKDRRWSFINKQSIKKKKRIPWSKDPNHRVEKYENVEISMERCYAVMVYIMMKHFNIPLTFHTAPLNKTGCLGHLNAQLSMFQS